MTGDIGAAADIATGALIGRAVEPRAGEPSAGAAHAGDHGGGLCLNCGTRLVGEHCHACGQSAHVHRSLGAIGHEIAHGVFHFEGKIWRTLPLLVRHPGTLTRRYVQGERARFVSPLALFLFTVFLMFGTIGWVGGEITEAVDQAASKTTQAEYRAESTRAKAELARLDTARADSVRTGKDLTAIDADRFALRTTIQALDVAAAGKSTKVDTSDFKTGWDRLDHGIAKAAANPGLMAYKLQTSAYKFSWGLIPLSVPFMALLFLWRRHYHLYDHAIFVTYSISFMMMLEIALLLASAAGLSAGWIVLALVVVPPMHMFAQLRGAYGLRKRSALWRTIALLAFAVTTLTLFLVLLLLKGLT